MKAHAGAGSAPGVPVKANAATGNGPAGARKLPGGCVNATGAARSATGILVEVLGAAGNAHHAPMDGNASTVSAHAAPVKGNASAAALHRLAVVAKADAVGLHRTPDRPAERIDALTRIATGMSGAGRGDRIETLGVVRHGRGRGALPRSRPGPGGAWGLHWRKGCHAPDEGARGFGVCVRAAGAGPVSPESHSVTDNHWRITVARLLRRLLLPNNWYATRATQRTGRASGGEASGERSRVHVPVRRTCRRNAAHRGRFALPVRIVLSSRAVARR